MAPRRDGSLSDSDEWVKIEDTSKSAYCAISTPAASENGKNDPNRHADADQHTNTTHAHPVSPKVGGAFAQEESSIVDGGVVAPQSTMQLLLRPHVEAVPANEASSVLGMASLRVPGIGNSPRLSGLDIVAVIDRSGSMQGQRMELVRRAVSFMCKQLRPGDRLALVSYSERASVDLPLRSMDAEGQKECYQALAAMKAGGCTNLGEGLLWGLGELASSDAPAAAMFLFTDGLANRGMTDTAALVDAMQVPMSDMGRQSRAVFSFGLGTDHNAQMLFSLADAGTGCYYYVDTAQAIAPSFADCLGGMLSIAAQDVTLTLRAQEGVSINTVYADFNVDLTEDKKEAHIKMRDLSGDAEKDVLFDMCLPALQAGNEKWPIVECRLSYVDVADGVARTQQGMLALFGQLNGERSSEPEATVEAHRCRLLAARAMEEAAGMLGKGAAVSEVQAVLAGALDALEKSSARTATEIQTQERMSGLMTDLSLCLETASDPRSCEKLCSSRAFAHKHQISTRAEGSEYRNSLQQSLAKAARREIGDALGQEQHMARLNAARFQPRSRASMNKNAGVPLRPEGVNGGTMPAGAVRAGMRIFCRGHPGKVQEISMSKTGKHGHAKAFFTVLCDDGVVRQDIAPSSHDIELAPEVASTPAL